MYTIEIIDERTRKILLDDIELVEIKDPSGKWTEKEWEYSISAYIPNEEQEEE